MTLSPRTRISPSLLIFTSTLGSGRPVEPRRRSRKLWLLMTRGCLGGPIPLYDLDPQQFPLASQVLVQRRPSQHDEVELSAKLLVDPAEQKASQRTCPTRTCSRQNPAWLDAHFSLYRYFELTA